MSQAVSVGSSFLPQMVYSMGTGREVSLVPFRVCLMQVLTLDYIQDPSHGWLSVSRAMARTIMGDDFSQISDSSYALNGRLYLEEDCDGPLFMSAAISNGYAVILREVHLNYPAPLRSYPSFAEA